MGEFEHETEHLLRQDGSEVTPGYVEALRVEARVVADAVMMAEEWTDLDETLVESDDRP